MILLIIGVLSVIVSGIMNMLAFLHVLPMYVTIPLLFLSIFFTVHQLNHRKTFKGF